MKQLMNDLITGFLLLAFASGIVGMTKELAYKAHENHKRGLMSYEAYNRLLHEGPKK